MDTTETYIKMSNCPEIQDKRPQVMIGSVRHNYKGDYQYEVDSYGVVRFWDGHNFIWLPLQHQLQEIYLDGNKMLACDLALRFGEYEGFKGELLDNENTSMEQLWLAFVMKEKFNKTWDGEKWSGELTNNLG